MEMGTGEEDGLGWLLCTTRNVLEDHRLLSAAGRPHGLSLPAKALCERTPLNPMKFPPYLVIISVDGLSSIMVCLAQDKNTNTTVPVIFVTSESPDAPARFHLLIPKFNHSM